MKHLLALHRLHTNVKDVTLNDDRECGAGDNITPYYNAGTRGRGWRVPEAEDCSWEAELGNP